MTCLPSVGLALPLFDEAALVDQVVCELMAVLEQGGISFQLALVDNGSRDDTRARIAALAVAPQVHGVYLDENAGYGGGILAGLQCLWTQPVDCLGWMWGDGQVDPAVLLPLLAQVAAGADLAKARRTRREDGLRRRVVTRTYAGVTGLLGVPTADVNGCPKLFRRGALEGLGLRSRDWFLDFEAVAGIEAHGGRVAQVDVVMQPRKGGRSKVNPATAVEFVYNLSRWKLGLAPHGTNPAEHPFSGLGLPSLGAKREP